MYKGDAQLPCLATHELGLQLGDWYILSSTRLSVSMNKHCTSMCACQHGHKRGYTIAVVSV